MGLPSMVISFRAAISACKGCWIIAFATAGHARQVLFVADRLNGLRHASPVIFDAIAEDAAIS
eukprot:4552960-Karenia_brevis.AAC.1